MQNITEDYVSFDTAKLLKEKGFDEPCECFYDTEHNDISIVNGWMNISNSQLEEREFLCYSAPTLQMAMKWLRDVHNLIVSVKFTVHGWLCDITKIIRDSNGFIININHGICDDSLHYYDEYEEACEEAIKYCLENLV